MLIYRKFMKLLCDVGHANSIIQILLLVLLCSFYQGIIYTYK